MTLEFKRDHLNPLDTKSADWLWLLGMLASDGCVSDKGDVSLSQSGDEGRLRLEKAQQVLGVKEQFSYLPKRGRQVYGLTVRSVPLATQLESLGINPRKSLTLKYPSWIPENGHPAFLAGYIDGDGCVGMYSGCPRGTKYLLVSLCGTYDFVHAVQAIVPIAGKMRKLKAKNCFELRWHGRNAITIGDFVWGTHHLGFKREAWQSFKDNKPRWLRYEILKDQALKMVNERVPVSKIAASLDIPFQTIYKWMQKPNPLSCG